MRILISSPFVKHVNRPAFQNCGNHRQPFPLSCGKIKRAEFFAVKLNAFFKTHEPEEFIHSVRVNIFGSSLFSMGNVIA